MRTYFFILSFLLLCCGRSEAQSAYQRYMKTYRSAYTGQHEAVPEADKKYFRFFPADISYKIHARFEKLNDTIGFIMPTTGEKPKKFYRYGIAHFTVGKDSCRLFIYQSDALRNSSRYRDHLFIPFTDQTSGEASYGGGRYIDILVTDIRDDMVVIDFNKSYNPYCAYSSGYNCPIPPRENDLPVAIRAGEKEFAKKH